MVTACRCRLDRCGRPLEPGDRASAKLYPRGHVRGTVVESPNFACGLCGLPALSLDAGGRLYGDGSLLRLKKRA